jgi:hypothetical protein
MADGADGLVFLELVAQLFRRQFDGLADWSFDVLVSSRRCGMKVIEHEP